MTRLACAKLIRRYILTSGIFSFILGIIAFLVSDALAVGLLLTVVFFCWMAGIPLLIYRNAFSRVTIDETGIRNKHIGFTWAEMEPYKIVEIKTAYGGIGLPFMREDIICFGEIPASRFFPALDPKKAVFIILDKKTKEALASLSDDQFRV